MTTFTGDEQERTGAFYTPAPWVQRSHDELAKVLGPNWKQECFVWDPAAGEGALTNGYDFADLISSTLREEDVPHIQGDAFQYDFLNDAAVPGHVIKRIAAARKAGRRMVWLVNPPYVTSGVAGAKGESKAGVSSTHVNKRMARDNLGKARTQLYVQFMYRMSALADAFGMRDHTIAVFNKPGHLCSG